MNITRQNNMFTMCASLTNLLSRKLLLLYYRQYKAHCHYRRCIITGAHMNCVSNHFRNNIPGLHGGAEEDDDVRLTFLFVLSVQSSNATTSTTPDQSTTAAEDHLNHYHVNSLDRWSEMVISDDATPVNGRMVKYWLPYWADCDATPSFKYIAARLPMI